MMLKVKQLKKNINELISVNYQIKQFIDYLVSPDKKELTEEDKENLRKVRDHVINLNVVFNSLKFIAGKK